MVQLLGMIVLPILCIPVLVSGYAKKQLDAATTFKDGSMFGIHDFVRPKRADQTPAASATTGSALSEEDAQTIVDQHNTYRKLVGASNMQQMHWDEQLAASSQAYANWCIFAHSTNRGSNGENIWANRWYGGSIGYAVTRRWYSEAYYCGCRNGYQPCCGHYSQLVWANTNRIGCGYAVCPFGLRNAPFMQYLLICQYSPGGNKLFMNGGQMASRAAFDYGPACESCPSGMKCEDGLCA